MIKREDVAGVAVVQLAHGPVNALDLDLVNAITATFRELDAGDEQAVALLREVGTAIEPELCSRGGEIVKRLGDGLMAVFEDPGQAIEAAHAAARALDGIEVDGHRPALRAGVHAGRPRRLGGDYFGVDVNIAARVTEAAGAGEVLVSQAVHERIEADTVQLKRRWRFAAKGAPKGLKVYAAEPS